MLKPRQSVPALDFDLVGGATWSLSDQSPENFTMVVVYRGLHCPICKGYLGTLNAQIEEFEKRGVTVVVLSSDDAERAATAKEDWKLDKLDLGYGLTVEKGRELGLYISSGVGKTSIGIEEPDLFVEPGIFMIRPDQTLYFATYQTMPFARPRFEDFLPALDFVIAKGYPARGEA